MSIKNISELVIAIKGAGEMATGTACRLFRSNFKNIFMMETKNPLAVRRQVAFCEAIHDDKIIVLNEGKVEDIGIHKELINRCKYYKEIASSQLSEEEVLA